MENKMLFPQVGGLIHGGDYNPDQWLDRPDILEEDIRLMKKAHVNSASLGIFSWAQYEKEEGVYDFEWLVEIMDQLYQNGIYTILATPSGARPAWLDRKYPEVRRVNGLGQKEVHQARENHCMTSPIMRKKTRDIDYALAQRVKGHPGLILWHISNEFNGYCYCEKCAAKFQDYLKEKFHHNIDELNHEYWTGFWAKKFNDFDEVDPPYVNGEVAIKGLITDWQRFQTINATDFMQMEIDIVKSITPDIPATTNLMDFFYDYDYRVMGKPLDVISWDSYPQFHNDYCSLWETFQKTGFTHSTMRALRKDKPFMLMESTPSLANWFSYNGLKKPGIHKLASMQAVANGSDTVQYFQWRKGRGSAEQFHGAVVAHDGRSDTRVFKEVSEVGALLEKLKPVAGSLIKAQVAILYDWDNRWALENTEGFQKENKKYGETLFDFYQQLVSIAGDVDVIGSEDDFSDYKVIVAPMMFVVHEGIGEKLKQFVQKGGQLLATYMLGYVNENQLAYLGGFPGDGLGELFGIYNEEIDTLYPTQRNGIVKADGTTIEVKDYCEIIHPITAEVLGSYESDFYKGSPAITVNSYNEGKAYYVAARTKANDLRDIFIQMMNDAEVKYLNVPENVEYHIRGQYQFYLNESEEMVTIDRVTGYNLVNDQPIDGKLQLGKYEVAVIELKK